MAHARVEEVSDSDPDEMDIADISPAPRQNGGSLMNPSDIPHQTQQPSVPAPAHDPKRFKHWACLYPIYFDASKTRAEGRRVSKSLAVHNPLAREMCDAIFRLGLQMAFEAEKTHPKDWANPGRVRVLLRQDGQPVSNKVSNKHHLYIKVAEHLKEYPADEKTPLRLPIAGLSTDGNPPAPPAVPRHWKMNKILPLHSPALSGGGVSEDLFKDMMANMQGGQVGDSPTGAAAAAGGNQRSNKKDKKKLKG
ncbi:MAG: signal recognition particle subunit [Chrysothrix sp. TS-e1954]|nr:MAG: signal recognition particle subunit [Chrysothrix sp. TS-e1954]